MADSMTHTDLGTCDHLWRAVDTGAVALAETLAPGIAFELREIRLHISAAVVAAESFTATADAHAGAGYDVLHLSQAMTGETDLIQTYNPGEKRFHASDEIDFAFTNSNTNTWGLEVIYKLL